MTIYLEEQMILQIATFDDNEEEDEEDKEEDEKVNPNFITIKCLGTLDLHILSLTTIITGQNRKILQIIPLMFSGNIDPYQKNGEVGGSSGYDFKNTGFTYTQLRFERDLDSWKMNFNWVPFSTRASWYFFIGIKSDLLK